MPMSIVGKPPFDSAVLYSSQPGSWNETTLYVAREGTSLADD